MKYAILFSLCILLGSSCQEQYNKEKKQGGNLTTPKPIFQPNKQVSEAKKIQDSSFADRISKLKRFSESQNKSLLPTKETKPIQKDSPRSTQKASKTPKSSTEKISYFDKMKSDYEKNFDEGATTSNKMKTDFERNFGGSKADLNKTRTIQNAKSNIDRAEVCSVWSPPYSCLLCYGSCEKNCFLCGGGSERFGCTKCDGTGRQSCECNCRAHDGSVDVIMRSKPVPCDKVIFGTWKSGLGQFTFFPNFAGNSRLAKRNSTLGDWVIEDGLFKMFFGIAWENAKWKKYYIISFDNNTLVLRDVDGWGNITFKKVK